MIIPEPGDVVIVFLKTGIKAEGVVVNWTEEEIILQANDNYLIVYNIKENLVMTKLVKNIESNEQPQEYEEENEKEELFVEEALIAENSENINLESLQEMRLKELVKTKMKEQQMLQENICKRMKSTNVGIIPVTYGYPSRSK